jgi:hypothetical protein
VLQEAELSGLADSGFNLRRLLSNYVLHWTGCTQEDDQLLRELNIQTSSSQEAAGHQDCLRGVVRSL